MDALKAPRLGRQSPTRSSFDPALPSFLERPQVAKLVQEWGFTPLPWQSFVVRHSLAVKDSALAYVNVGLSVPRQNGKTETVLLRAMVGMIFLEEGMVYTSYKDDSAAAIFERFLDFIEQAPASLRVFFPVLPSRKVKERRIQAVDPRSGKKLGYIRFVTRAGGGGRGKTEAVIFLDEAQALTSAEYDSFTAAIATVKSGQVWFMGTPEPVESSATVGHTAYQAEKVNRFAEVRKQALQGKPATFWAEWGVASMVPKTAKDAWYEANPSLGYDFGPGRGLTERVLEAHVGSEESFAVEHLGFWSEQDRASALEVTRWHKLLVEGQELRSFHTGKTRVAVAIKSDVTDSHLDVAWAVRRPDGRVYLDAVKSFDLSRPWQDELWKLLEGYLKSAKCKAIIVDGVSAKAQVRGLLEARGKWRSAGSKAKQGKVVMAGPTDLTAAAALLVGAINEGSVAHSYQPLLDAAVADAGKRVFRSGSGFGFYSISGKTSSNLLEAVALALGEAVKARVPEEQPAGGAAPVASSSLVSLGAGAVSF